MFPYSKSVTPAVRSHLDSQSGFFNELSRSMASSFQSLCEANLQLSQTMFEESMNIGQRMLTTDNPADVLSALSSSAQPAAGKLRAYQQHVARLAADTQVNLSRVTEQHVPQTARTAQSLADEVARVADEETIRGREQQEEIMKKFTDPFSQDGARRPNGSAASKGTPQGRHDSAAENLQSDGDGAKGEPQSPQAAQQGNKSDGKLNR